MTNRSKASRYATILDIVQALERNLALRELDQCSFFLQRHNDDDSDGILMLTVYTTTHLRATQDQGRGIHQQNPRRDISLMHVCRAARAVYLHTHTNQSLRIQTAGRDQNVWPSDVAVWHAGVLMQNLPSHPQLPRVRKTIDTAPGTSRRALVSAPSGQITTITLQGWGS